MLSITRLSYTFVLSALLVLLASPGSSNALSSHHDRPFVKRGSTHAFPGLKKRMEKRFGNFVADPLGTANNPINPAQTGQTTPTTGNTQNPDTAAGANGQQGQNPTTGNTANGNGNTGNAANNNNGAGANNGAAGNGNNNGGIIGQIIGGTSSSATTASLTSLASTTSAAATTTSVATSTTVISTTATTTTPTIATPTITPTLEINTATAARPGTISLLSTISALPTPSYAPQSSNSTANTFGKNTIIAIAVIAGSIGGVAAIWTLVRKWKLGPSAKFEDRMQPIEWNPDGDSGLQGGAATREKDAAGISGSGGYGASGLTRKNTDGSFHSGDASHMSDHGRNVTGNNMFAEQDVPPAHDFTAGANGGYGHGYNTGYVDLQRNASGGGNLDRQASNGAYAGGYGYDQQHQAYGAHNGEDAYAQDAYGGYDAGYDAQGHQQPQQGYANDPYGQQHQTPFSHGGYGGGRY